MEKDYNAIASRMIKAGVLHIGIPEVPDWWFENYLNCLISALDEYDAAHPVKTYAQDFFEKFPDAEKNSFTGCPAICIRKIYPEAKAKTPAAFICMHDIADCSTCWNRPMEESK